MKLDHLHEYDEKSCLEMLAHAGITELWDSLLRVQTELFFAKDVDWLTLQKCWQSAKSVLDFGSGNGAYLHKLYTKFPDKKYLGIEKQPHFVEAANLNYRNHNLQFQLGDAEIENDFNTVDIVFFRLTLQHLKNPMLAIKHVHKYLKDNGHVIIIRLLSKLKSRACAPASVDLF